LVLRGLGETLYSLSRFDDALEQYALALDANSRAFGAWAST
jgi:hypothetical protein